MLWSAFKTRLGQSSQTSNLLQLPTLIHKLDNLHALEAPFSKEEIDNVVKQLTSDKALGVDGFNGDFIEAYWDIISFDFYKLIEDFSYWKYSTIEYQCILYYPNSQKS